MAIIVPTSPSNTPPANNSLNYDIALKAESALQDDKLSRRSFAEVAAKTLKKAARMQGLVVSIEGAWGSGKTSTLALIEALLLQEQNPEPVIVHFNPWMVGDKDSLLSAFFSQIATAIGKADHSANGLKVASEIKTYAKVFDLIKLVPGAEPWASIVKSVLTAASDATASIAEHKTKDIEGQKKALEDALHTFGRPIIVFIDDIDRLFPQEVFEVIRVIKAIGGLTGIGYLVAWDAKYVSNALEQLGIPLANTYLDKIVQVRLPLPALSAAARMRLVNEALDELDKAALADHLPDQQDQLNKIYHSGLSELLEQPRDIIRVFNTVKMQEPLLRGEIAFADILGLAALTVKAPEVFELLRNRPDFFVGKLDRNFDILEKSEDILAKGKTHRQEAYDASGKPRAVMKLVYHLFPRVAGSDRDSMPSSTRSYAKGNISDSRKLVIAMQLGLAQSDSSCLSALNFLTQPGERKRIASELNEENCIAFFELLGDMCEANGGQGITDPSVLCLDIAELIEQPLFVSVRERPKGQSLFLSPVQGAQLAIERIINITQPKAKKELAIHLAKQPSALSLTADLFQNHVPTDEDVREKFALTREQLQIAAPAFGENVLATVHNGNFFDLNDPDNILWQVARHASDRCKDIFEEFSDSEQALDRFALYFTGRGWDSSKGYRCGLPQESSLHDAFCPLSKLKDIAHRRLLDTNLDYPTKAAWRAIAEGKTLYAADGSEVPPR